MTEVIARFDDASAALMERLTGQGRILALTSGWQPGDSQFALSSKFIPFIGGLLDLACGGAGTAASVAVLEPVTLPKGKATGSIEVRGPDGKAHNIESGQATFTATDRPGIYVAKTEPVETRFAVNIAATESNTAPLDLEQLEQSGMRRGSEITTAERVDRIRQQRDTELESRQKIWRWLIVLAIVTLILEILLAGRAEQILRTATPN